MTVKNKYGFTLIELLVVIAIIALLLAILVPALSKGKDYVKRITCLNNIRQLGIAVHNYAQSYNQAVVPNYVIGDTPPKIIDLTNLSVGPYNSYMVYHPRQTQPTGASRPFKPFHLAVFYELGYIDTPKSFYCPAQPRTTGTYAIPYYYEFYIGEGDPADYSNPAVDRKGYQWGTVLPADTRGASSMLCRTSYNYWIYGKRKLTEINGYKPIIFDNIQEWEVVPHRKSRGANSMPQGLSALYADSHATFCSDLEIFDDTNNWPWNKNDPSVGSGPGNFLDRFNEVLRRIQAK